MDQVKAFLANDIVNRALKTFLQTFVSTLVVTGVRLDWSVWAAAGAAGLSAMWNYLRAV